MVYYDDDDDDEATEYNGYTPRYTQNPRDRGPGILTYDDREYLLGLKDVEGASETQLRQRMRDRIRNGLLDFELLFYYLSEQDINTIFSNIDDSPPLPGSDGIDVYHGAQFVLAFLYQGINEHTHASFQRLLESAIQIGEQTRFDDGPGTHEKIPTAAVDIEITWDVQIDMDHALERLRNGKALSREEIGTLVIDGDLRESDWELIHGLKDNYD